MIDGRLFIGTKGDAFTVWQSYESIKWWEDLANLRASYLKDYRPEITGIIIPCEGYTLRLMNDDPVQMCETVEAPY